MVKRASNGAPRKTAKPQRKPARPRKVAAKKPQQALWPDMPPVGDEELASLVRAGVVGAPLRHKFQTSLGVGFEPLDLSKLTPKQLQSALDDVDTDTLRQVILGLSSRRWSASQFDYHWLGASLAMETADLQASALSEVRTSDLLRVLSRRGGCVGQVANAALLVEKKSEDYNQTGGAAKDGLTASRDVYFPFGRKSYVHMIHTKSQRLVSLAQKDGANNFEGVYDTALDLINYASFLAEREAREELNSLGEERGG